MCGKNVSAKHGINIVEFHYIKYIPQSVDNSQDIILVLCPNYHGLIHMLNPKFNQDELQYIYPDGRLTKQYQIYIWHMVRRPAMKSQAYISWKFQNSFYGKNG